MHINETLKNFLYDLKYFITVYEGSLYVNNYLDITKISETNIDLKFDSFEISIKGSNLVITKMTKEELKIKGIIKSLEFNYE